jgi:hypothetical protein
MAYEYFTDEAHLRAWLDVETDLDRFQRFLDHYVFGVDSFEAYLERSGGLKRMQELRRQEFLLDRR